MTVLEKARLFCPDSNELDFQFMFNPDQVQFKEALKVGESESARTESGRPKVSFEYPKARTLQLKKVMFDTYESGEDIMAIYIDSLRRSVQFQGFSTGDSYLPRPPIYKFIWGTKDYITCFIEKLDYKLTMFLSDGTPVRAEVNLSLKEVDDSFLSSAARTYHKALFGDRDTRKQPPEPISVKEANEYYLNDLKNRCENGKELAEQKRQEAKKKFDPEEKVVIYEHKRGGGASQELGDGLFNTSDLTVGGISSMNIPAGYKVTLHTENNGRVGRHDVSNTNTFSGEATIRGFNSYWNDNVRSITIELTDEAQARKDEHDELIKEAEALEKNSESACEEYKERKNWYG